MKAPRRLITAAAVALSVLAPIAGAQAAAVCRSGRVELILGGLAPAADCPAPAAARPPRPAIAVAASAHSERIAPEVQRERDSERRRILEDELRHEQQALVQQQQRSDAEALGRTRANIAALQGELSRLPAVR